MDNAGCAEFGKAVLDILAKVMPYGKIILGRNHDRGWFVDASVSWVRLETAVDDSVDVSQLLILLGERAAQVTPLRVPPRVIVSPTPTGEGTLDELF